MCTTNNEKTWDMIIKTVLRKDISVKKKIQLSAFNHMAQQQLQYTEPSKEKTFERQDSQQKHENDINAIMNKGNYKKLPTLKKTLEMNSNSLDNLNDRKSYRNKKYPDILIKNNLRVTKDRLYNDFR
jgi:hypothetical protein